ncbi:MAG: hypothetical protein A2X94_03645 [Bdellovibrionales bacterium GWB1_55_8]|nr:MAG: hypothetical protein A2X94_03645 [Bdellovibrionales bacterium GWB1_55_8]
MNRKVKKAITALLLLFVALSVVVLAAKEVRRHDFTPAALTDVAEPERGHQVIAYYFHGNARCTSCRMIEALSYQTLQKHFEAALSDGHLVWRLVNVELPENSHFIRDYQLVTKSLVLIEQNDGTQKRWKNLEAVWNHLNNPEIFERYVKTEVEAYLADSGP